MNYLTAFILLLCKCIFTTLANINFQFNKCIDKLLYLPILSYQHSIPSSNSIFDSTRAVTYNKNEIRNSENKRFVM